MKKQIRKAQKIRMRKIKVARKLKAKRAIARVKREAERNAVVA